MRKKILFLIIIVAGLANYACKKTDSGGGMPVITAVRSMDTTARDSVFTEAVPGTLIVIQGSNMGGLQAVFFNDTSAYFNPVYATSTNVIITIPSSSQTAATNPNVPSTIKLITDHGTATYSFTLYLPPPVITSITFDNSGSMVFINGYNFQGIKKITFPVVAGADTALSYKVNKTFTQITAAIPPGETFVDSLRVYCTYGTAAVSYPPPMTVTYVSNENGTAGTTITIKGTNFIGINKVIFPGGLEGTELQTISVGEMTVKVPAGIATPDSLRLVGALGTATAPQLFDTYISFPSPGYLSTFDQQWASDNTSFVGWTGGYADGPTTTTNYPNGTGGSGVLINGSPMGPNTAPGSQGNAGLLQLNPVPWVSNTGASVADYSMKFEVFVASPWKAGTVWISLGGWYNWSTYTARFAPWTSESTGVYQPTGWTTITIPLSQFITGNQYWQSSWNPAGSPATHFSDYGTTDIGFLINNDQATAAPVNSVNIAIDNVRIVKGQ